MGNAQDQPTGDGLTPASDAVPTRPSELGREVYKETGTIIILGDKGVGKSSVAAALAKKGASFHTTKQFDAWPELFDDEFRSVNYKDYSYDEKWSIIICHATGKGTMEEYLKAIKYSPEPTGFFIVYDVTRPETLKVAEQWYSKLLEMNPPNEFGIEFPYILLANKCDLEKERVLHGYEQESAILYIKPSYDTSTKSGLNIENALETMVTKLHTVLIPKRARNQVDKPSMDIRTD